MSGHGWRCSKAAMGEDEEARFAAWLSSAAVGSPLRALWKAKEAADRANSPAARNAAQTSLGAALTMFCGDTGVAAHLRAQMVDHALSDTIGEPFREASFEALTRPETAATAGGRQVLHRLAARGITTMFGVLGAQFSAGVAGALGLLSEGYDPFWEPEPKSGVRGDGGPLDLLRRETVNRLGYSCGAERHRRLTADLLTRAVSHFQAQARRRGFSEVDVKPGTIRDWAMRSHSETYALARRAAAEDLQSNSIKRHLLLPRKTTEKTVGT